MNEEGAIIQTIRVLPSERVGYAVVVQGIPMLGDMEYEYECLSLIHI